MAQNRNRAKRKCRTSFFPIYNFNLKFEPLDAELNSATENQTHFSKKVGVVPRKAAKFEKVVWNLKKKTFVTKRLKTRICWDCLYWNMPQNCETAMGQVRFWFQAFKVLPHPFFHQTMAKRGQKVIVFFLKNCDKMGPWFCDFWIARWCSFVHKIFSFFDFGLLHGEKWPQSWTKTNKKCKLWKLSILIKIFWNSLLLSFSNNCGTNLSKAGPYLEELGSKNAQKCSIATKTFQIF